jgi:hypothetical protein
MIGRYDHSTATAHPVHKETETMTAKTTAGRRVTRRLGMLAAVLAAAALLAPAAALAAEPVLEVTSEHVPTNKSVPDSTYALYRLTVNNTGTEATSAPVTVKFRVPAGLKISSATDEVNYFYELPIWSCAIAGDEQSVSCEGPAYEGFPLATYPGEQACEGELFGLTCRLLIFVKADANAPPGTVHPTAEACGGGAAACDTAADDPVDISSYEMSVPLFDGKVLKENGDPATQAGSHPYRANTVFTIGSYLANTIDSFFGSEPGSPLRQAATERPVDELEDATVELPPGLVGNPRSYPQCTQVQLVDYACPPETQVGVVRIKTEFSGAGGNVPVFNMEVPYGLPALFGFINTNVTTMVYAKLRSGEDYGLDIINKNVPQTLPIEGVEFEFWGVPSDPSHDLDRGYNSEFVGEGCAESIQSSCSNPSTVPLTPFLTLPTSCVGPVETSIDVTGWLGGEAKNSFLSHDNSEPTPNLIGADGCNSVDFSPTVEARPTTNVADAPSGLDVDVHLPQNEEACDPGPPVTCGTAEAQLKDASITLPKGLVINPASGNGLDGCSPAEVGLTTPVGITPIHATPEPANCPDASKLGTVEVDTPLLDRPVFGSVYLADPYENPFESLLALYITVNDPQSSVVVKLAGKVTPDPSTGQLTTTFEESPQLPFEDIKLKFFGGSGGALRTPPVCGNYSTGSLLVPWTTPDGANASPTDNWAIAQGPNGGACANSEGGEPNAPSLDAGTVSPIAGAYSPMVVNLRREDGSQNFSSLTFSPPPGLTGKLAGIPYCSDSALAAAAAKSGREEEASPSCPAASEVGVADVAAGAGPAPYHAHGKAYLTGPYKAAPISLAVITPATAGPFDLGTVVTRTALFIDSKTAQITAKADPLPSILQGIPLDIRSVQIRLDRPDFSLNPTSCDAMTFAGELVSTLGQSASLSNRFQLGECGQLGLGPKMSLTLRGGTKRRGHPALRAVLENRAGDANLRSVSVALPATELLDQSHIGTVCTKVQFAADQCPADSIYGSASVTTPLLDYELTGPVYLRSSENKLPDLVPDLRGPANQPIKLEAAGRTDTVKGALRNTFEAIPDAPFSKLVLTLSGGKKGLIQNSRNVCAKKYRATVKFISQNGLGLERRPLVKAACRRHKRHQKKKHRGHRHRRHRVALRHLRAVR